MTPSADAVSPVPTPVIGTLQDLARSPDLRSVLVEHAHRGFRVQLMVRAVLAVFIVLTVLALPPARQQALCFGIAGAYAVWAVVTFGFARRAEGQALRLSWLSPFGDLAAIAAVTAVASVSDERSWTADVLVNGMFLIPILVALQLRVWTAVAVTAPTAVVFIACCVAAQRANGEPWASVSLRSLALIGVCLGAVLLVRVQSSRIVALGRASVQRTQLLRELSDVEQTERRQLSERLHDGALQYVLAARQDLADLPPDTDPKVLEHLQTALNMTSSLLRSQLAELNPAVLEQAGLVVALERLAQDAAQRAGFALDFDASGWPGAAPRSDEGADVDRMLFDTARELLANVVTHAHAHAVTVRLDEVDHEARLTIDDDGVGMDPIVAMKRVGEGHIGLASRRIRLESAGGRLVLGPGPGGRGTRATATLPLPR